MVTIKDAISIAITADGSAAAAEFQKIGAKGKNELGKAEGASHNMSRAIAKTGVVATGAGLAIGAAMFSLAKSAEHANESHVKLNRTIETMPRLAGASVAIFQKQQRALMATTTASDETTASLQSMLGQVGLTQQEILRTTPVVLDFAAATGQTVEDASAKFVKAIRGNKKALGLYTQGLELTKDPAENLDAVVGRLADRFEGAAAEKGKTLNGQLEIMKNRFDNVKQAIGEGAAPAMQSLLTPLEAIVAKFDEADQSTKTAIGSTLAMGSVALTVGGTLATTAEQATILFESMKKVGSLKNVVSGLGYVALAAVAVAGAFALAGSDADVAIDGIDELGKKAFETGESLRGLTREVILTSIATTTDLRNAFQSTGISTDAFVTAVTNGGPAYDALATKINGAQQALAKQTSEGKISVGQAVSQQRALKVVEDALETQRGKYKDNTDAQAALTAEQNKAKTAQKSLTRSHEEEVAAIRVKNNVLERLRNRLMAATDADQEMFDQQRASRLGVLDMADAIDDAQEEYVNYVEAIKEFGAKSPEATAAARELERAQIGIAQATDDAMVSIKAAALATAGGETSSAKYRQELVRQATALAPGSALRVNLEQYIAWLDKIDGRIINTTITVNGKPITTDSSGNVVGGSGAIGKRAAGGPVSAGRPYIVGENGPEMIIPTGSGMVVPNHRLGTGREMGGGNVYNITVTTLDARTAGTVVVDALKQYERTNGRVPIKVAS